MNEQVGPEATVLVVDDEKRVADLYATHLRQAYRVKVAYSGGKALELIDGTVNLVLLDRRMPELSGDEVLEQIRDAGYDCRVIVVTAVEPDFDIIDMPFDDYLVKPVGETDIMDAVEQQLLLDSYDARLNEYFRLKAKLATLEGQRSVVELEADDRYEEMTVLAESLREDLEQMLAQHDTISFRADEFGEDENRPVG